MFLAAVFPAVEKNNKVYLRTLMQYNISRITYTVELHYEEEIVSVGEL